jgi:3D (Asp-Asp-Asp) domain-containing protein
MLPKSIYPVFAVFSLGMLSSCTNHLTETVTYTRGISYKGGFFAPSYPFLPQPAAAETISQAKGLPKDKHGMPTYSNHSTRTRYVRTTSFSHMENEPGAHGRLTASGSVLKYGNVRSAAADWSVYPLGTTFKVKGQPHLYVVDDYGSALAGTNTIDIYKPTLQYMKKWGTRHTEITVVQWGSYERSANMLRGRVRYNHCRQMYYGCMKKLNNSVVSNDIERNGAL